MEDTVIPLTNRPDPIVRADTAAVAVVRLDQRIDLRPVPPELAVHRAFVRHPHRRPRSFTLAARARKRRRRVLAAARVLLTTAIVALVVAATLWWIDRGGFAEPPIDNPPTSAVAAPASNPDPAAD